MSFLWSFINDFLTNSTMLIGLVVLVGLLVQRKPANLVIIGTLKTIMGVLILGIGAGVMAGVIASSLSPLMIKAFNAQGLVPMTTSVVSLATTEYGTTVAYVIIGSFVFNLLLAKFSPFKYIFLAGHHILYTSATVSVGLAVYGVHGPMAIIAGSLIAGLFYTLLPAINQKYMKNITNGQPLAMGHFGATGYWMGAQAGKLFSKDKEKSTEDLKLPKALSFAKEIVCAATLVIVILLVITVIMTGPAFLEEELGVTQNIIVYILIQGITFGAGLTVLLQGVRMMISEILSSFEGIAMKLVPNAIPALDCPVVFPFAPNAVLIGFVAATIAGVATSIIFGFIVGVVVVPPVIEFFFMGGTGGVFGNSTGGYKGAILGGAIQGVLFIILPYLFFVAANPLLQPLSVTVVDPDFAWSGMLAVLVGKLLSPFM